MLIDLTGVLTSFFMKILTVSANDISEILIFITFNVSKTVVLAFTDSIYQGLVVQRVVSLTNSLVVKMLTVLVSIISNSQVFLLKKSG